ncbi:MAG: V-type ATP synthase subunit A, partial [Bacilli bacterium]
MNLDNKVGIVSKVAGPLIVAKNMRDVQMYDVVRVSNKRLIGEVIELRGEYASIQVYEETAGIGPGEPVYLTNEPLSVELAPGLIQGIFDGIQRPLDVIYEGSGDRIPLGIDVPKLNRETIWEFAPTVSIGDKLVGGDIIGEVQETSVIKHYIMLPINLEGEVTYIHQGKATITDVVCKIKNKDNEIIEVAMLQKWP